MHLTPDRLVAGGDAMARDADGRVVFVEGALPGEVVEVEIDLTKKDFARGHLVEIVEPSPFRDSPSCSHRRNGCGGCDWMHLRPEAQFDAKVEIVRESLRRVGRLAPEVVDGLVDRGEHSGIGEQDPAHAVSPSRRSRWALGVSEASKSSVAAGVSHPPKLVP